MGGSPGPICHPRGSGAARHGPAKVAESRVLSPFVATKKAEKMRKRAEKVRKKAEKLRRFLVLSMPYDGFGGKTLPRAWLADI
jgi:hypothetical protein